MLRSGTSQKNDFLERTKAAREERLAEKARTEAILVLQCAVRTWLARLEVRRRVMAEFDATFPQLCSVKNTSPSPPPESGDLATPPKPALEMYRVARLYLHFLGGEGRVDRLETLLRYIVKSLDSDNPKLSYIGVFLIKAHSVAWIHHIKQLASAVCKSLVNLSTDSPSYHKRSAFLVLTLISFTSTSTWRIVRNKAMLNLAPHMTQICHTVSGHLVQDGLLPNLRQLLLQGVAASRISMKRTTLSAVMNLALRPVQYSAFSQPLVSAYIVNILSVPGLLQQTAIMCPETLTALYTGDSSGCIWSHSIKLLSKDQQLRIHFNALEGSYALCLTANLIHLLSLASPPLPDETVGVVTVLTHLLSACAQYVTAKQSNLSHWHPVLGWFSVSLDKHLQASMGQVKIQLAKLWSSDCVKLLTAHLTSEASNLPAILTPPSPGPEETNFGKKLVKQAIEKTKTTYAATTQAVSLTPSINRLGNPACTKIALVCSLYQTAIRTLSQLRIDILNGLCFDDLLLRPLWLFLNSLGPNCGLKFSGTFEH